MALRVAIASGNWSNPAIWNSGVIPGPNDIVASNTYTVTIDQNINVNTLTNTAQTKDTIIPLMTSNTAPSGIASSNVGVAWQAFDNSTSYWLVQNAQVGDYVQYQFPTSRAVDQYDFSNGTSFNGSVSLQGSNDGTNFTTLHTASVVLTGIGTYTSPSIGNSTTYLYYRFVLNSAIYVQITYVRMYEYLGLQPATAGGGFILNSGVTVTTINGVSASNLTCLTYSGSGTSTIIGSINALTVTPATYTYTLVHSGTGTLNIIGSLYASSTCSNRGCLTFTGSGILNVTGNILGGFCNSPNVDVSGTGTMNVVGYVEGGSNITALNIGGNARVNITGDVGGGSNTGRGVTISGANTVTTITGNLVLGQGGGPALNINAAGNITVTGSVGNNIHTGGIALVNTNSVGCYLKIIGTIYAGNGIPHVNSLGTGAVNILTGPFISSPTGIQPFYVARMHYQLTMGSYYEFRDSSTNGALPPAVAAPATRLVSPDTIIGSLLASDVRSGIVYSAGSLLGTMIVPSSDNVSKNIPVDNTVGTAVLDPNAIWAVPLTSINTLNSIGRRVKNAATVETTGAQIQQTLNNNE